MNSAVQPHLEIGVLSHPGEKRDNNEDSYVVSAYQTNKKGEPAVLAVVADGIGGHQAGEVASKITVDTVAETLVKNRISEPLSLLSEAVYKAGSLVAETSQRSPEFYGMGSTVAIAWVIGKKLYTAHVGDSRIYFLRDGNFRQITTDHTWVQEAIEHEIIDPEEARTHPNAHVLQRAIGSPQPPEADLRMKLSDLDDDEKGAANQGVKLREGDKILLCSDGLTDLVEDDEIYAAMVEQTAEEAVQSLVSLARARGGHDNITIVILSVPQEKLVRRSRKSRLFFFIIFLILSFVLIVSFSFLAGWWFGIIPWPLSF
jgi:protein phosphatase